MLEEAYGFEDSSGYSPGMCSCSGSMALRAAVSAAWGPTPVEEETSGLLKVFASEEVGSITLEVLSPVERGWLL
jgi:hypothetical protein